MPKSQRDKKTLKKGIGLDIDLRKFVLASLMIFFMLVLPIFVIENGAEPITNLVVDKKNPYSQESINNRQGQVAGISTERNANQLQLKISSYELSISENNDLFLLIAAVICISLAIFMLVFSFLGKFDQ